MKSSLKDTSRYLSLLLRHKPENENLVLDKQGYTDVEELCDKLDISFEELEEIVRTNDKKRFAFNSDQTKIRASQGHSIDVDLEMIAITPPEKLYHGTKRANVTSIFKTGLNKGSRNHVHLTDNLDTAQKVGDRRKGETIILIIDAWHMRADGFKFYQSENNVWLTENVPAKYIILK